MHISKIVSILFIILFFIFFITFLIKRKRINYSYDNLSLILLLFSLVCLIIAIAGFFIPTPNKEGFDTSTEEGFVEDKDIDDDKYDDKVDDKVDDDEFEELGFNKNDKAQDYDLWRRV